jgi:RNA polymerase sigma-70 factor (ECF subfamily)
VKKPPLKETEELIPTRESLLGRLKDLKDDKSWRDFFFTYWKLIYGVARRAGLTDVEAQEVVQETVISVSKHIPDFKYNPALGSFKGWLLNLTRWRICDQIRRRQADEKMFVRPTEDDTDTTFLSAQADPAADNMEALWDEEWQRGIADAAIQRVKAQVTPKQFQIFDLYVLKEWPMQKVTSTLGVNIGQVYLAKHRIMILIRKAIKSLEKCEVRS